MHACWAICRRDLIHHFTTPLAWLILFVWTLLTNGAFAFQLYQAKSIGFSPIPLFSWSLMIGSGALLLLAPAITMNCFASERNQGTLQLLFTVPIRDLDLVLGKFLAAFGLLLALVAISLLQPAVLFMVSDSIPTGELLAGYTGLFLLAAFLAAFGIWISLLVDSSVAAYVITMGLALVLWLGGWMLTRPEAGIWPPIVALAGFLGLEPRSAGFRVGRLDSADIGWFIAMTGIFLTLAHGSLQARRSHG